MWKRSHTCSYIQCTCTTDLVAVLHRVWEVLLWQRGCNIPQSDYSFFVADEDLVVTRRTERNGGNRSRMGLGGALNATCIKKKNQKASKHKRNIHQVRCVCGEVSTFISEEFSTLYIVQMLRIICYRYACAYNVQYMYLVRLIYSISCLN